jgi:hypothetical protein
MIPEGFVPQGRSRSGVVPFQPRLVRIEPPPLYMRELNREAPYLTFDSGLSPCGAAVAMTAEYFCQRTQTMRMVATTGIERYTPRTPPSSATLGRMDQADRLIACASLIRQFAGAGNRGASAKN